MFSIPSLVHDWCGDQVIDAGAASAADARRRAFSRRRLRDRRRDVRLRALRRLAQAHRRARDVRPRADHAYGAFGARVRVRGVAAFPVPVVRRVVERDEHVRERVHVRSAPRHVRASKRLLVRRTDRLVLADLHGTRRHHSPRTGVRARVPRRRGRDPVFRRADGCGLHPPAPPTLDPQIANEQRVEQHFTLSGEANGIVTGIEGHFKCDGVLVPPHIGATEERSARECHAGIHHDSVHLQLKVLVFIIIVLIAVEGEAKRNFFRRLSIRRHRP